jgi:hypothetical protein
MLKLDDLIAGLWAPHRPNDSYWFKIVQFNEMTGEFVTVGYMD